MQPDTTLNEFTQAIKTIISEHINLEKMPDLDSVKVLTSIVNMMDEYNKIIQKTPKSSIAKVQGQYMTKLEGLKQNIPSYIIANKSWL